MVAPGLYVCWTPSGLGCRTQQIGCGHGSCCWCKALWMACFCVLCNLQAAPRTVRAHNNVNCGRSAAPRSGPGRCSTGEGASPHTSSRAISGTAPDFGETAGFGFGGLRVYPCEGVCAMPGSQQGLVQGLHSHSRAGPATRKPLCASDWMKSQCPAVLRAAQEPSVAAVRIWNV